MINCLLQKNIQKPTFTNRFMYSFDISNVFSSVPISETIDNYTDFLYRSQISSPAISGYIFVEL